MTEPSGPSSDRRGPSEHNALGGMVMFVAGGIAGPLLIGGVALLLFPLFSDGSLVPFALAIVGVLALGLTLIAKNHLRPFAIGMVLATSGIALLLALCAGLTRS